MLFFPQLGQGQIPAGNGCRVHFPNPAKCGPGRSRVPVFTPGFFRGFFNTAVSSSAFMEEESWVCIHPVHGQRGCNTGLTHEIGPHGKEEGKRREEGKRFSQHVHKPVLDQFVRICGEQFLKLVGRQGEVSSGDVPGQSTG
ncbi:MAG: hypothetical protein R2941_07145 [Desulfobacterales bacterium]